MTYGERERLGIFESEQAKRRTFARFIEHKIMPMEGSPSLIRAVRRLTSEALKAEVEKIVAARIADEMPPVAPPPKGPPVRDILALVAEVTGYTVEQLCGPWRQKPLSRARFLACWTIRQARLDLSLPAIGKALGRDHSTILNAVRVFERERDLPPFSGWLADARIIAMVGGK